jgi:hypothetical protein
MEGSGGRVVDRAAHFAPADCGRQERGEQLAYRPQALLALLGERSGGVLGLSQAVWAASSGRGDESGMAATAGA